MCLAVPGKVLDVTGAGIERQGRVSFGGNVRVVNLAFLPEVTPGDFVIVHVGFAIARLDEAAARHTLALLEAGGEP